MYKRKLAHAFIASAPALLPLTALAQPKEGNSSPTQNKPVLQAQARTKTVRTVLTAPASGTAQPSAVPSKEVTANLHLAGHVSLPDKKSAANAIVLVSWMQKNGQRQSHKIICKADGKFDETIILTNELQNKALGITAYSVGKGLCWQATEVDAKNLQALDLPLLPGTTLEGRLLQSDGRPLAATPVRLKSLCTASFPPHIQALLLLPADVIATLAHATTDGQGKFSLTGVPKQAYVALTPGDSLTMAQGSLRTFMTSTRDLQETGIFVATPLGSVKVRVVDALSGEPIPALNVGVLGQAASDPSKTTAPVTDSNGEYIFSSVQPGDRQIYVMNKGVSAQVKTVQVKPGSAATLAEIRVRQGALRGILTDANGKPAAHTAVTILNSDFSGGQVTFDSSTLLTNQFLATNVTLINNRAVVVRSTGETLARQMQANTRNTTFFRGGDFNGFGFGMQGLGTIQANTTTDANGNFEIKNFPWALKNLQVRAARGNDVAEWRGTIAEAESSLKLQLRPNALVSVTGRLVDPKRRPLANVVCQALHWLPTSRATWFATAREVRTNANGEFTVVGLERGESFSVITTGQNGNIIDGRRLPINGPAPIARAGQAVTSLALPASATPDRVAHDFESPRFMTCHAGDGQNVQNLGEVMVHPSESSEEVLQSYGSDSPGDQPELPGVLVTPTGTALQAAQLALARWESALKAGDVDTLQRLTAHVSSSWSSDKQAFLQRASLCGVTEPTHDASKDSAQTTPPTPSDTYVLRFVPRSAVTALLQTAPAALRATLSELHGGDEALSHNADWAFLLRAQEQAVGLAGVLHREEGEWHVVLNPTFNLRGTLPTLAGLGSREKNPLSADTMTPNTTAQALAAGTRYLQTWMSGDKLKLRGLTSPVASFIGSDLDQFRQKLEKRADGGVCPLATGEKIALQPVTDLAAWEPQWLEQVAGANPNVALRQIVRLTQSAVVTNAVLTAVPAAAPEVKSAPPAHAVLRYTAQGHDFLILLCRSNKVWQVVEPALPL